jgi:hypothetical protein
VETVFRWVGFGAGVVVFAWTVVAVMKILIVPRRSWTLLSAFIGRYGYKVFHGVAVRLPSFDAADRFLGFLAPVVIISTLGALMASFVLAFALLLLPWADLTVGDALREAGSSVFTLGFVGTPEPVPTALDVTAGAVGMIFVALTIGWLPALHAEVKNRERLVKQLAGWAGSPSWGPELLARFSLAGAIDELPGMYRAWDIWCAQVSDTHLKYPVLPQFRLPRSRNHWLIALQAIMDAAALDIALRPDRDHATARLMLRQGMQCLQDVAYPMRRIHPQQPDPGIGREDFDQALTRLTAAGFPIAARGDAAWDEFAGLRSAYAPLVADLAFWLTAVPAPWSGERDGFPDLVWWPDAPEEWSID